MGKKLDPLEMTLKRFPHLRKHKDNLNPSISTGLNNQPEQQDTNHGLQICPNCGSKALRLDGGCSSCLACGWSACHNS